MQRLTKHLQKRYFWAASVLVVVILSSTVYVMKSINMQRNDAKVINIAGMQRMLSQKIALHKLAVNDRAVRFEQQQLARATMRFYNNHEFLLGSQLVQQSPQVLALYHQQGLDGRVRQYVQLASRSDAPLSAFQGQKLLSLLQDLDAVVTVLESESKQKIEHLQLVIPLLTLAAIATILCEWWLIFNPLTRRVSAILYRLRYQRRQAAHAHRIKSDFLANMSHELMTPITGIIGLLDSHTAAGREEQQTALGCARHLQALVQEMLELQKLKSGAFTTLVTEQSLKQTVSAILAPWQLKSETLQRLSVEGEDSLPVQAQTDHLHLIQAVNQLLSNAFIHTRAAVHVQFEYHEPAGLLSVVVKDNGDGIATADIEAAQQHALYYNTEQVQHFQGAKLGLSLVYALAQEVGGSLTICSTTTGTEAKLTWPAITIDKARLELSRQHGDILIVEDNPINQLVLAKQAQQIGFNTTIVDDGEQALDKLLEHHYQCVLMDLNMPNKDGISTIIEIRERLALSVPIFLVTASQDEHRIAQSITVGANAVLNKPVNTQQLSALLKKHVTERAAFS